MFSLGSIALINELFPTPECPDRREVLLIISSFN